MARAPRSLGALALGGLLLAVASPAAAATPAPVAPGATSFTISTEVLAAPAAGAFPVAECPGGPALLVPGVARCLVYRVDNHLDVPITVRTLTMRLDPAHPAPPAGCAASALELPEYSGVLVVPARGSAVSPGLPITLADTAVNQNDCKQTTLYFVYGGTAEAADAPGPSDAGTLALTGVDLPPEAGASLALALGGLALTLLARRRARADARTEGTR